ncbi:KN motif and ankyrin repeat domain-containing protein 1 isoform X2 [Teleopsis dalmanni]|uniref:KN motif and ankyrin repeat domain-containing protein 1 isoform X2 n=1 Tax=Teleopsis dalmanni TaxID=139649 RepID=UPI0018CF7964|nr:KN motif and ankyrin repeat domain-containing protein 1 isoform X2 [Teleopsis dalmanni]XP_037955775.1 KN motif and ankyrin repeat domain-containing protein 1 isoform X2 [Teleopsis dalmanni]
MSLVMRSQRAFSEENGRLPQTANVRSCDCCPYGYHIDLDFVRYCESLANAKPSEEELRRRANRRSRISMEFMLGMESLFEQWDAADRVQAVPEVTYETEPDSPRLPHTSTPYQQTRPRSSSVPRFTYGGLTRAESPFGTASSTCSSIRGTESDVPYTLRRTKTTISPPETRAFLRDALDEVCSDFERTLERTSMRRKKNGVAFNGVSSDRNNNTTIKMNGFSSHEKRNGYAWEPCFDVFDSCVSGNKSPRASRLYSRTVSLPFHQKPSPGEQKYESYVQATVAANAKSPVEVISPPAPPPRRHVVQTKSFSPNSTQISKSPLSEQVQDALRSTTTAAGADSNSADAQTLFNIREQMALSLKRMKDLEEQVKSIPVLKRELTQLRDEKQLLQQTVQRKDDELLRARDTTRLSSSPSPAVSPKFPSPVQFTPQRISPVALESLGARLRTNSSSSEKQAKPPLKRDVGTMCGLHTTRDIAVGSPIISFRTTGTNPDQNLGTITETLYSHLQMEERVATAVTKYEEERTLQQLKKQISVGTQMYVSKLGVRDSSIQTALEKPVQKYAVAVLAKPQTRESFVTCKPSVRTVASSEHSINDVLCEKCASSKRTVACGTEDTDSQSRNAMSLKQMEMPPRSNTFSLGENEKLTIKRKTIGTQSMPVAVRSEGNQTSATVVHTVGVQHVPEMQNSCTQSQVDTISRQTDTSGLIQLCTTQTSVDEVARPITPEPDSNPEPIPPKPETRNSGTNTLPSASIRHFGSNTEQVHKRDIGCGEIIKPHISIACADNYCDSCKDAIKHLAKDFSKVSASPLPTRAVDSKIPRPKPLPSPVPVRRQFLFQRQNTYTVPTPPLSPEKKIESSLHEKTPTVASFQQLDSASETQSFIPAPTNTKVAATRQPLSAKRNNESLNGNKSQENDNSFELTQAVEGDLIVKEEKRVSISWSRDASPAPISKAPIETEAVAEIEVQPQTVSVAEPTQTSLKDVSKGARRKNPVLKSSQDARKADDITVQERPPSKALLQKLATEEAEPRQKFLPNKEVLTALKFLNNSLLKKMGAKPLSSSSLKAAKSVIQQEWYRVSSSEQANPHEVEDYLDCFEGLSVPLLEYCVNMSDANGNTAMHYAVSHGNFDVVSILLDSKVCNVNQMNNAGYTCVMLVALAKLKSAAHRTVVERLFQMADVNVRAKKHCQTALMLAVSHGNLDMVQLLLAAGADINIQDEDGSSALMCAAEHGRVDIVKQLLTQTECNSLLQDVDGSTAFKIAWQAGHRDVGLLLYVHEQMLRSKLPNQSDEEKPEVRQMKQKPSK